MHQSARRHERPRAVYEPYWLELIEVIGLVSGRGRHPGRRAVAPRNEPARAPRPGSESVPCAPWRQLPMFPLGMTLLPGSAASHCGCSSRGTSRWCGSCWRAGAERPRVRHRHDRARLRGRRWRHPCRHRHPVVASSRSSRPCPAISYALLVRGRGTHPRRVAGSTTIRTRPCRRSNRGPTQTDDARPGRSSTRGSTRCSPPRSALNEMVRERVGHDEVPDARTNRRRHRDDALPDRRPQFTPLGAVDRYQACSQRPSLSERCDDARAGDRRRTGSAGIPSVRDRNGDMAGETSDTSHLTRFP